MQDFKNKLIILAGGIVGASNDDKHTTALSDGKYSNQFPKGQTY